METERRRAQRIQLVFNFKIFAVPGGEFLGYLADITTGGLMLLRHAPPLAEGTRFFLELRMDKVETFIFYEMGRDQAFRIPGEIRWCRPLGEEGLYTAGVMYTDLTPAASLCIDYLIRKLRTRHESDEHSSGGYRNAHMEYRLGGVMFYLQASLPSDALHTLNRQLVEIPGILAAQVEVGQPRLLVVQYNADTLSAEQIQAELTARELPAQLVHF